MDDFELIEGEKYIARDGKIIGPVYRRKGMYASSSYCFETLHKIEGSSWVYRADGRVYDDSEHPRDLVKPLNPPKVEFTPTYLGEWEDAE